MTKKNVNIHSVVMYRFTKYHFEQIHVFVIYIFLLVYLFETFSYIQTVITNTNIVGKINFM